jgi:hypothetical protein
MKIRTGFVSNSSSASFVVPFKIKHLKNNQREIINLLSSKEVKLLKRYGFFESCNRDPYSNMDVDEKWGFNCNKCESKNDQNSCSGKIFGDMYLRYNISCNENEPIDFLLKHNIPFYAGMDYDGQLMVYKRDSDKVLILQNEGIKYIWGMMNMNSKKYFKKKKFDYTCDSDQCSESYKTIEYITKEEAPGA